MEIDIQFEIEGKIKKVISITWEFGKMWFEYYCSLKKRKVVIDAASVDYTVIRKYKDGSVERDIISKSYGRDSTHEA